MGEMIGNVGNKLPNTLGVRDALMLYLNASSENQLKRLKRNEFYFESGVSLKNCACIL